jgi:hypothetical protein
MKNLIMRNLINLLQKLNKKCKLLKYLIYYIIIYQTNMSENQTKKHDPLPIKLKFTREKIDTKYFFKRIKPIEGIVKYDLTDWTYFPTDLDKAKEIAKKISHDFSQNKKYNGFVVNVYFHIEKKNLRFEIKKYQTLEIVSIKIDEITNNDEIEKYLDGNLGNEIGVKLFELQNYVYPELDMCKELGKKIAVKFESINPDRKYIVFFNPKAKTLKITIHKKIIKPNKSKVCVEKDNQQVSEQSTQPEQSS